jgi:hypothetical protein
MKKIRWIALLVLVCTGIQAGAQSAMLGQEVTLTAEIKTVEGHLKDLREKGLNVYYVDNHVDLNRPIRLVDETDTLESLLKDILREQPLQLIEKNNSIYLVRVKVVPPPPVVPKKGKNFVTIGMRF